VIGRQHHSHVDSDGEATELRKCGFGELNPSLGGGGHIGDHGSNLK
jgi:hypothetical protein